MDAIMSWQALTASLDGYRSVPVLIEVTRELGSDATDVTSIEGLGTEDGAWLIETVSAGLGNAGFDCDWSGLRVSVEGDVRDVSELGLALAAALLAATGQGSAASLAASLYIGGIAQDGTVLPARGILVHLSYARTHGLTLVCTVAPYVLDVPWNVRCIVFSVSELRYRLAPAPGPVALLRRADAAASTSAAEVQGCAHAKRAACIALTGGHALGLVCDRPELIRAFVRGMREMAPPLPVSRRHDVALARSVAGLGRGSESRGIRPLVCVGEGGVDAVPVGMAHGLARHGILFVEDADAVDEAFLDEVRADATVQLVAMVTRDEMRRQTEAARRTLAHSDIVCLLSEHDVDRRVPACWGQLARVVRLGTDFSVRRRERAREGRPVAVGCPRELVRRVARDRGVSLVASRCRVVGEVARSVADLACAEVVEEAHVVEALTLVAGGMPRP